MPLSQEEYTLLLDYFQENLSQKEKLKFYDLLKTSEEFKEEFLQERNIRKLFQKQQFEMPAQHKAEIFQVITGEGSRKKSNQADRENYTEYLLDIITDYFSPEAFQDKVADSVFSIIPPVYQKILKGV